MGPDEVSLFCLSATLVGVSLSCLSGSIMSPKFSLFCLSATVVGVCMSCLSGSYWPRQPSLRTNVNKSSPVRVAPGGIRVGTGDVGCRGVAGVEATLTIGALALRVTYASIDTTIPTVQSIKSIQSVQLRARGQSIQSVVNYRIAKSQSVQSVRKVLCPEQDRVNSLPDRTH